MLSSWGECVEAGTQPKCVPLLGNRESLAGQQHCLGFEKE